VLEIDHADGRFGMEGHGRPAAEMPRQCRDDVLGKQHAAGVHPEGAFDAARVELGKAPRQLVERHLLHRLADAGQRGSRARRPGLAFAGERQRAGGGVELLAEIAPQQVPGGIRLVDHARIAQVIAVGMADQAMLVHRRGQRIGQRALLEQLDRMSLARQGPRGRQSHDPAAHDDGLHGDDPRRPDRAK
jgi:hypothetical protein